MYNLNYKLDLKIGFNSIISEKWTSKLISSQENINNNNKKLELKDLGKLIDE